MTDKYGLNPTAHADQEALHSAGEDAGQETWHGDHPPIDDLAADHAGHGEEGASVSEEGEAVDAAVTDIETGTVTRRSLPILPLAAGIVLVGILGFGLYWQFGASRVHAPMPVMATNAMPVAAPPSPAPEPTAPTAPLGNSMPANDAAPTAPATFPAAPAAPAPTSTTNQVGMIEMPAAPTAPAPALVTAPASAPVINASPTLEGRLNTLSNRVEDLQKSLSDATQKLGAVSAMLANQAAANANSPEIDDRLNKIEQQLMQLEGHRQKPAAAASQMAGAALTPATTAKKHKTAHVLIRKPKAEPAATPVLSLPPAQTAQSSVAENWILRAATPSEAWIAKDATTSDLRHIQIGDSVASIGKVQAIRPSANGWVIEGTQGTIH